MAIARSPRISLSRRTRAALAAATILLLTLLVGAAAFPVGMLKGMAERRLSAEFDAPVAIGTLSRTSVFSFTPEIVVQDLRIVQPAWAGKGDFLKVTRASARLSIFDLITGNPETVALTVAGASKDKPLLKLVDPLRIGGTFSNPSISVDSQPTTGNGSGKGIIGSIGRSIGSALGLRKNEDEKDGAPPPSSVNCKELAHSALL